MLKREELANIPGRGGIRSAPDYCKAKMLNHTGWAGKFPRNITPSDIDMLIENRGRVILIELSPTVDDWGCVSVGQRESIETLVRQGTGGTIGVVARHNTSPDKYIDTEKDITSWEVMYYDAGSNELAYKHFGAPSSWFEFMMWWFYDGWFTKDVKI